MLNSIKHIPLHRVFHGIRFKVNKVDCRETINFFCMTGMPYICGESPQGTQLPTNPIATCKFRVVTLVVTLGREEAITNSWPDEQKPDTKAYQADKLAKDSEVPKGNRNLDA